MTTTTDAHAAILHFRNWLARDMTGCAFAAKFARSRRNAESVARYAFYLGLELPTGSSHLEDIATTIDAAARDDQVAVLLFPKLRTEEEIAQLILALARGDRWSASIGAWKNPAKHGPGVPISLRWRTPEPRTMQTIGFASLLTMPATRRAPYVAVAVWGGSHRNRFKQTAGGDEIGIIDVFPGKDVDEDEGGRHQKLWDQSKDDTKRLCTDPYESSFQLQRVAFVLAPNAAKMVGVGLRAAKKK